MATPMPSAMSSRLVRIGEERPRRGRRASLYQIGGRLTEAGERDDARQQPEQAERAEDQRFQQIEPRKPQILNAGGRGSQCLIERLERPPGVLAGA